MNYEERYNVALERAKKLYGQGIITECLGWVFPELKESKDERIRKGLIKAFGTIGKKDWGGLVVGDILDWLEKQREKLDPDKVIGWLIANICDFEYYVKLFKKDFEL